MADADCKKKKKTSEAEKNRARQNGDERHEKNARQKLSYYHKLEEKNKIIEK